MTTVETPRAGARPYPDEALDLDLRWWATANFLTAGQIYLLANPLLREPLRPEHVKPRLLGHWGTSPGLTMVHTLLNRLIRRTGQETLLVTGPGHGGPAVLAGAYLDGTYSEVHPEVSADVAGLTRLVRQFSTPGGVSSHAGVHIPGSIHEGGELGYALLHAAGAAFDDPDLLVACVVGDGEAETGPLAASWRLPAFLNPRRDGAVLPILHVNGYKISGPTVLGRSSDADLGAYLHSQGWDPVVVAGDEPRAVFRELDAALSTAHARIRALRAEARAGRGRVPLRWPAVVLRTPKGWTGPRTVDGVPVEGTHRSHQVPLSRVREDPAHLAQLERWLRSYRPEDSFDAEGRLVPELAALVPDGDLRLSATPRAGGPRFRVRPLPLPDLADHALPVPVPGVLQHETTRPLGGYLRDLLVRTGRADGGGDFRLFSPDETNSNRLGAVFEVTDRCSMLPLQPGDEAIGPDGRVVEVLSEHLCEGWLEGYTLTGRHGLFATYEAFAMVSASMVVQHAKWLQTAATEPGRSPVPSLNVLLTSTTWRNDHNGFSHQGPGLIDTVAPLAPDVTRIWFPPDANSTLVVAEECLRSRGRVNLVVVDKQRHLQYLDLDAARTLVSAGAAVWEWAGTEDPDRARTDSPDVVLAAAGDVPTMEVLAAAQLLREHVPHLRVRVVEVVDLMGLLPPGEHPAAFSPERFRDLFTDTVDVVFAFHGHPRAIHPLVHGRPDVDRFHVRGFTEHGTTTTPFDMVVVNRMSRYDLVLEALRRSRRVPEGGDALARLCREQLRRHREHVVVALDDLPEVRDWTWQR
ncbi:xylulose-5-phosphate/fructose-6-phosphate phosphoketolase [Geodermatophilus siccatus]|uniref:Xylulose-5-phosphate/fructose-6-phosphate phosphoketolase n=1 Tax=Geodermatophilus siccatus TaxID=1137991 RepID=A0A1G9NPB2_9ACTN|nr:phosphoketolase family protein [Geodermatophilus siccatus]SDL87867.1 xylulose-5-phosphate/fructose-6-phosphate phosphoketolase [Geodermatophilus siccatus]